MRGWCWKGNGSPYQGCANGYSPPLIPCLHHRRVNAFDSFGKGVEVTRQEPVQGKMSMQDIKKLHQPCRDIFRHRQIPRKWQAGFNIPHQPRGF